MRVIEYQNLKFIDILMPTDDDVVFLKGNFNFHNLILEEIKTPTYHPLLGFYEEYLFWILHFPELDKNNQRIQTIEVDFLITQNALVAIRYQNFADFESVFDIIYNDSQNYMNKTSGHLFHHVVKRLFSRMFPELDKTQESINHLEDTILETLNEQTIEHIASIKRDILDFIRALKPQKSIWDSAPEIAVKFWGGNLQLYFNDLAADYNRMLSFSEIHKEIVDSLHSTASSLLDNKRNYVIKILTIFTAILLPLSLVASIFGMNLQYLPGTGHPASFWFFVGGMVVATAIMLCLFRLRKWI